jgi:hypothetical protein
MKIIATDHANQHNDLTLTAYAESNNGTKWRALINRNFYDFQSSAVAARWDGSKWQEVYRVVDVQTLRVMKHNTVTVGDAWLPDAEYDALFLLTTAALVVGE